MNPQLTSEGMARITWAVLLAGIPCVLLIIGAFVGIVVMLVRGKRRNVV